MSFEKDLLRLKKDERIMKSIRSKIYHQNEAVILSPNPWKKFLFFDNFGSKTNILAYFPFDQKQLILQNDPFYVENEFYRGKEALCSLISTS